MYTHIMYSMQDLCRQIMYNKQNIYWQWQY